jgi:hypothetical protein
LFISLLFNAFQAFGELASTMLGRPIVNKHRAYTFHRPSALWIAQIIVDMAFACAQIMMFSIIVYFMCGLVREAGAFFIFYIVIVVGYLAMTVCYWFISAVPAIILIGVAILSNNRMSLSRLRLCYQICSYYHYTLCYNKRIHYSIPIGKSLASVALLGKLLRSRICSIDGK